MTHVEEELLIAFVLDEAEPGTRAVVDVHLAACEPCRKEAENLRRVLRAAASDAVPARGEGYGAEVWARIEPHLPPVAARRPPWSQPRAWLAAAAVALLAVSAFVTGRWTSTPAGPHGGAAESRIGLDARAIRERVVLAAVGDHVERAERTLLELTHASNTSTVDISAEQAWARQLLDANRLYRQSLQDVSSPALADLLDELEPILLELVNSPSRLTRSEVEALQSRVEERSLLFKLRMTGAQMRARQRTLIPNGEPRS